MNHENTLLVDDTPYKSLFNPPFNVIFPKMLYKTLTNGDYLLRIVLPYLETLHSS
jgi:hypothetical protein